MNSIRWMMTISMAILLFFYTTYIHTYIHTYKHLHHELGYRSFIYTSDSYITIYMCLYISYARMITFHI